MSNRKSNNKDFQPWGLSPLGGNAREVTSDGFAAVRTTGQIGVPLVYDRRVKTYISKLAVRELDDREHALRLAKRIERDEALRSKMGFK